MAVLAVECCVAVGDVGVVSFDAARAQRLYVLREALHAAEAIMDIVDLLKCKHTSIIAELTGRLSAHANPAPGHIPKSINKPPPRFAPE